MNDIQCSPEELLSRQTATFTFVPFIARLFTDGTLRADSPPLLPAPSGMTAEVVARLREIWKRVVWRYLARECGWRALPATSSAGAHVSVRLWQTKVPRIQFTAAAMELCVGLFNATRTQNKQPNFSPLPCGQGNGDLFLQHLAFRRLRRNPLSAGLPHDYDWSPWANNPLNSGWDPAISNSVLPKERWALLTTETMVPFLPWLLTEWTSRWLVASHECQEKKLNQWREWQAAQRRTIDGIMAALVAHNHPIAFIPLMEWYARMNPGLPRALKTFELLATSLRLNQRQAACADWHHTLGLAEQLHAIVQDYTALHPADREPCHRLFLAASHTTGFADAVPAIRSIRQILHPVIS